uniref:Uncharacterized protein n=1 Tax=Gibberella zeae TaxID=5518 RepID=A0A4E9EP73_GIBZA
MSRSPIVTQSSWVKVPGSPWSSFIRNREQFIFCFMTWAVPDIMSLKRRVLDTSLSFLLRSHLSLTRPSRSVLNRKSFQAKPSLSSNTLRIHIPPPMNIWMR